MTELDPEEVEDAFVIDRDLDEPDSRGEYHGPKTLRNLPEDLREQINAVLKAVRKLHPEIIPDKQTRDRVCLSAMRRAFELKLAEYSTGADDDARLLSSSASSGRLGMALTVRYGEKLLLHEAMNLASEKISGLLASQGDEMQPSAKRLRTR